MTTISNAGQGPSVWSWIFALLLAATTTGAENMDECCPASGIQAFSGGYSDGRPMRMAFILGAMKSGERMGYQRQRQYFARRAKWEWELHGKTKKVGRPHAC